MSSMSPPISASTSVLRCSKSTWQLKWVLKLVSGLGSGTGNFFLHDGQTRTCCNIVGWAGRLTGSGRPGCSGTRSPLAVWTNRVGTSALAKLGRGNICLRMSAPWGLGALAKRGGPLPLGRGPSPPQPLGGWNLSC